MRSELKELREHLQRTVASQVELIFNILGDLEVDSRFTVLEQKVDVFAKELNDLIGERVAHFTKWEVQQHKDLKGQVMELQEELAACKKELARAMRQGCIAMQPREKKMQKPRSYDRMREARRPYTDACDIKTWEKFKRELKRQLYPESIKDMVMINLRRLRQKGSICKYVREYSTLMLEIPEMSER
ncbi:hypothetical protein RJ639_028099 [Escallonia herrerae]|uniref:Retrotransposon gag domain-containing protein n=1 Tax=Escallonia herrerae TaxID=1293975 RepID=A0AA88X4H0_9ASTE|nr:hypothetical protein RJ639_028099 [Escallonia herrerae]